jgi:hypothetical protein
MWHGAIVGCQKFTLPGVISEINAPYCIIGSVGISPSASDSEPETHIQSDIFVGAGAGCFAKPAEPIAPARHTSGAAIHSRSSATHSAPIRAGMSLFQILFGRVRRQPLYLGGPLHQLSANGFELVRGLAVRTATGETHATVCKLSKIRST